MSLPALLEWSEPSRPTPRVGFDRDVPSSHRLAALALTGILILLVVRCGLVAARDSITSDESTYLSHTLHFWATGDDQRMWALGTPRWPHLINAWPSYRLLTALERHSSMDPGWAGRLRERVLSDHDSVIVPARLTAILWGVGLIGITAWGVGRRRGIWSGVVAAGLVSLMPEILAHGAIAGSDMPFAAAAMLAVVLLTRHAERPTRGRWLAVAVAVGLAWATRHSGVLLVALAIGTRGWLSARRAWPNGLTAVGRSVGGTIASGAGLTAIAGAILWAGDGFQVVTPTELSSQAAHLDVPQTLGPLDVSRWPIPTSLAGLVIQVRHQSQGHQAYFLGERGERGWPTYFPVAFLLKTPIGWLGLMVLAVARFRPRDAWEAIILAFLGLLWLSLTLSHVNIGLRYALLTYPLTAPWIARHFEAAARADRVWGPVSLALAVVFVGASISAHPRYLSWFNELGGGPERGWLYLADSNIDWGQDLDGVGDLCERLGIREITTDISSERRLSRPGLRVWVYPSRAEQVLDDPTVPPNRRLHGWDGHHCGVPTRHLAVSVSRLMGLYSQNDLNWLRGRRLVGRVGDSIFLFDLDQPADRPFGL